MRGKRNRCNSRHAWVSFTFYLVKSCGGRRQHQRSWELKAKQRITQALVPWGPECGLQIRTFQVEIEGVGWDWPKMCPPFRSLQQHPLYVTCLCPSDCNRLPRYCVIDRPLSMIKTSLSSEWWLRPVYCPPGITVPWPRVHNAFFRVHFGFICTWKATNLSWVMC